MADDLLLTFYGDDFTGSTDVLESLALNGVQTVLFLEPPSPDDLAAFDDVSAVGVAGRTRTMAPDEMEAELREAFAALAALDAEGCHYKVCSTFDSSPEVGSIGRAVEVGRDVFDTPLVPLVVAAPSLEPRGRYVLFGNLFATVDGETYRLDRHPTMRDHPVTPMTEADLRRHLEAQSDVDVGLVEVRHLEAGDERAEEELASVRESDADVVLFDGLTHDHQRRVGRLVREGFLDAPGTTFAVGSSGFEYALTGHLRETGAIDGETARRYDPDPLDWIVVLSGSASPVTAGQIEWALDEGFEGIRLDAAALVDPDEAPAERDRAVEAALSALETGESPLLYSARGPDDPALEETRARIDALDADPGSLGERLGTQQGRIARAVLERSGVNRLCVAGGDTSGYVGAELDLLALEFAAPVGPGSPLCHARSRTSAFDGLEVALKGGQVETTAPEADYFGVVRSGGRNT